MSSAVRSLDQLDRRVQYFYALDDLDTVTVSGGALGAGNILVITSGATVDTVMTASAFAGRVGSVAGTYNSGTIFRDMGKQVTINNGLLDTQVWRRVQVVSGATFEGVTGLTYEDTYVLTWVANPSGNTVVNVARTG